MGYYIYMEECTIKFSKENMELILQKLSNYFKTDNLRWVNGFNIEDMIAKEDDEDTPLEIEEIWDDLRYEIQVKDDWYVIDGFLGEKLGDDLTFFNLIAEYCEDGYIEFTGEDGERFRFVIKGDKAFEQYPSISWEEDINKETITISIGEYESLLEKEKLLEALENYGVDNWGGYEDACKSIQYEG